MPAKEDVTEVGAGEFPFYQNYAPPKQEKPYVPLKSIDIPQGAGSGLDANTVMRLQAFTVAVPLALCALGKTGKLPISTIAGAVLASYANNAAAVAGGLSVGSFYRNGADPAAVFIVI